MNSLPLPSPPGRRWLFFRTPVDATLAVLAIFSCLLVALRILRTSRMTFLSMPWNLFLAYVPYVVSTWLARCDRRLPPVIRVAGLSVWVLFIPNTFYILTDLFHLADRHRNPLVPEWYDLALILSFALNGMLLGVLSIRQVERLLAPRATFAGRWMVVFPILWLNALGVYIGRFLRYNSWDIFFNPVRLAADIAGMIIHPLRHDYAWSMICCYSILLALLYNLLSKITDHGKYALATLEP